MIVLRRMTAVLLAACLSVAAHGERLFPVDEAASVPDFFSFRAQLMAAVARRDTAFVLGVLANDVLLSFGGDQGVKRRWRPEAADTQLWAVLGSTLALGGTFSADGTFTAPYVHSKWPDDKDAFEHTAAIGSGIRVRNGPSADAAVIGSLDFDIVEVRDRRADGRWIQIRVAPDRVGFVDARFLRSPIDYRVRFARLDGRWHIVFFVAGD